MVFPRVDNSRFFERFGRYQGLFLLIVAVLLSWGVLAVFLALPIYSIGSLFAFIVFGILSGIFSAFLFRSFFTKKLFLVVVGTGVPVLSLFLEFLFDPRFAYACERVCLGDSCGIFSSVMNSLSNTLHFMLDSWLSFLICALSAFMGVLVFLVVRRVVQRCQTRQGAP
jgi:hypothetical protein